MTTETTDRMPHEESRQEKMRELLWEIKLHEAELKIVKSFSKDTESIELNIFQLWTQYDEI